MNGLIKIGDVVMTGLLVVVITILLYFAITDIQSKSDSEEVSVPHNYHIIYDDNNKMLIVPNEYHFHCDEKGSMILTK